jgi:hypothetical protein
LHRRRTALARIEAALETRCEFPEICGKAPPRCHAVRRDDTNFDCGRPDQALDFRHRSQETPALMCAERRQHRRRQLVREPVIGGQFRSTLGGQPHAPPTAVGALAFDGDEALRFERAQQPAQIAGIEPEPVAQRAQLSAFGAGLENQARLAQWSPAAQIALLQSSDPLRDEPVKPSH